MVSLMITGGPRREEGERRVGQRREGQPPVRSRPAAAPRCWASCSTRGEARSERLAARRDERQSGDAGESAQRWPRPPRPPRSGGSLVSATPAKASRASGLRVGVDSRELPISK